MKGIADFLKNKIKQVRFGQLDQIEETPAVNMTKILLNPKNILIIPYNRMGTILLATRVFKAFREHYTSAKITIAVYEPWSVLISKDPTIDSVVAFGDDIETPNSRGFQNIGKTLAIQKFDLAFYLSYQFDPVMAYLTRLSDADLRVSFKSNYEIPYFNVELIPATGNRYEVDRYLEMLRTLGIEGSMRDYTLKISDNIRQKARLRYLTGFSPDSKNKFIGFDLTKEIAGEPLNKKNTEQVINALISGFDATIIVFFEPQKKSMVAELKESFGKKIILVEDRPVSIVAGLMSFCRFVVTHNTDLFQLTVALKTPNIGILYPKEMIQWSPGEDTNLIHLDRSRSSWSSANTLLLTAKKLMSQSKKTE